MDSTINLNTSIINFPSYTDENGVKIFDESSIENRLAYLSHYIHNPGVSISDKDRNLLLHSIIDYLESKPNQDISLQNIEENFDNYLADPCQYSLFSDFFNVPYPNPNSYKFSFIDLFAGIGGIRLPFTELGYKCVFSSEWDKYAQQTYLANFGEMPFGDICKDSTKRFIPKDFDVLLAGFPCQAFSIIGKMRGFEDTRGTLFFEVADILKKHRPKAFLLENVKQLTTHDKGRTFKTILSTLEELGYGYKWAVLNALDFGVPQKRERVIIVGFSDKKLIEEFDFTFKKQSYSLEKVLEDESDIDPSLYASEKIFKKRMERTRDKKIFYPSVWHENKAGNISILDHACALRTGASYNYLLINGVRRPSSRELMRFQGFPDKYLIKVSHGEIRRQTGNSVAVPMIREIARKINDVLTNHY